LHVGQAISDVEVEYRKRIGALGGNTRWLIIDQDGLDSGPHRAQQGHQDRQRWRLSRLRR
jgi:hypothetical protein